MFINPCDENYSGQNLQIICEFLAITPPLVTYFSGSKSGPSNFVVPYLCQLFGTSAGLFFLLEMQTAGSRFGTGTGLVEKKGCRRKLRLSAHEYILVLKDHF